MSARDAGIVVEIVLEILMEIRNRIFGFMAKGADSTPH